MEETKIDSKNSKIFTTGIDGSKMVTKVVIDTLTFKVFALLMCRGTTKEKANAMFNMSYGVDKIIMQGE